MVGNTNYCSYTEKANRSQSAQNSAGIQTLLDVRSPIHEPDYCPELTCLQAEKEAQKIVQKGMIPTLSSTSTSNTAQPENVSIRPVTRVAKRTETQQTERKE
jgi:hypothetical protein